MSGRLQNRIAVVTGSNSGIGRGIAIAYGHEGAVVVCASRQAESKNDAEKDVATHDLITKNGGKAIFKKMEFSQSESINALVKEVVSEYGRIDVWVNNAGMGGIPKLIWEHEDEIFDSVMTAAAQMITQEPLSSGNRGSIINICSVFGPRGFPTTTAYSATKAGVQGMVKAAAMDLASHNVTINSMCVGRVLTNMTSGFPEEIEAVFTRKCLLGNGQPEDIAGPAILLASDEGRW